jgi:hypothetical protein
MFKYALFTSKQLTIIPTKKSQGRGISDYKRCLPSNAGAAPNKAKKTASSSSKTCAVPAKAPGTAAGAIEDTYAWL